jgi:hypothetical protein
MIYFLISYFSKKNLKIFLKYFKNISLKAITKVVKNQADVARVIPFAPHILCQQIQY